MALVLPSFPDQPDTTISVELDGVVYRLRYLWSGRRRAWFVDLATEDGEPIVQGRRLCPRESPLSGVADDRAPRGRFIVTGPDGYFQRDLGRSLLLLYVAEDELPAPTPTSLVIS